MKEGTDKGVHRHSEWQKRKNTRLINNTFIWYIYIVMKTMICITEMEIHLQNN